LLIRLIGYLVIWLFGYLVIWLFGYLLYATQITKSSDKQITKPIKISNNEKKKFSQI